MYIGAFETKNTNCKKLLGIKVDRLNFNEHLDGRIKKTSRKINALSRITTQFMNISKRRILVNSYFNSKYNYSLLGYMLQGCSGNS